MEKIVDPLRVFFEVRDTATQGAEPFESGEHLWIGNEGAARAVKEVGFGAFGPFKRRRAPEALTYGEIVAFSGDFYESAEDLFDEKPSPVPWLWEDNDLSDLRDAFKNELAWINLPPQQRKTSYPDQNVVLWWNAKQYAELALRNTSHFGWHNALAYAKWHEVALGLAAKAHATANPADKDLIWRQAVYTNGFADHFLTDGFAAGHVRTPVGQIRSWAERMGWDQKLAGALSKLIHDQDGHVDELHSKAAHGAAAGGLHVTNAEKADWFARCDGQLFLTGTSDPSVEQTVQAVAVSVKEFLRVAQGGPIPQGVFPATRRMPWPHASERPLIEKFPPTIDDARVKALCESIAWYVKMPLVAAGVQPSHVKQCIQALGGLMDELRAQVAKESSERPEARRIAPELIHAYRNLR